MSDYPEIWAFNILTLMRASSIIVDGARKRMTFRPDEKELFMAWNKDFPKGDLEDRYGAALILDLKDSSFVWDQSKELAHQIITRLREWVEKTMQDQVYGAEIGNFTGDGFLVVFPSAEQAIHFAARLIDDWEAPRSEFEKKFLKIKT